MKRPKNWMRRIKKNENKRNSDQFPAPEPLMKKTDTKDIFFLMFIIAEREYCHCNKESAVKK